jgi:hypothetical protein
MRLIFTAVKSFLVIHIFQIKNDLNIKKREIILPYSASKGRTNNAAGGSPKFRRLFRPARNQHYDAILDVSMCTDAGSGHG